MTKSEEMASLDLFILSLPTDTYLHEWLTDQRDHIESAMRSDSMCYCSTFAEYHAVRLEDADKIRNNAKLESESMVRDAKIKSAKIRTEYEQQQNTLYDLGRKISRIADDMAVCLA